MVARDDQHDWAPAVASASASKNGAARLERLGQRPLAQLDDVAEQDDPVGARERLEQDVAGSRGRRSRSTSVPGAEVQVGERSGSARPQSSQAARGHGDRDAGRVAPRAGAAIAVENPATGETLAEVPELGADEVAGDRRGRARAAQPGWEELGFEAQGRGPARRPHLDGRQRRARGADDLRRDRPSRRRDPVRRARLRALARSSSGRSRRPSYLADEEIESASPFVRGRRMRRPLRAGRRRRRDRPLELPAQQLLRRLHPGARGRQRGRPQAVGGDAADVAADGRDAAPSRACPRASSRSPPGAGEAGAALVDEVDFVMFTGSVETGKKVMAQAAETLTPVSASSWAARTR